MGLHETSLLVSGFGVPFFRGAGKGNQLPDTSFQVVSL